MVPGREERERAVENVFPHTDVQIGGSKHPQLLIASSVSPHTPRGRTRALCTT